MGGALQVIQGCGCLGVEINPCCLDMVTSTHVSPFLLEGCTERNSRCSSGSNSVVVAFLLEGGCLVHDDLVA
jgi:hypothetical protein